MKFIKKPAKYGRFSVLGCTFQGQKHGCKDFGLRFQLPTPLFELPTSLFELRRDKTPGQDDPTGWGSLSSYHHQIIKRKN
jgi:hypothetical protein